LDLQKSPRKTNNLAKIEICDFVLKKIQGYFFRAAYHSLYQYLNEYATLLSGFCRSVLGGFTAKGETCKPINA
jgi:hypothetical protein